MRDRITSITTVLDDLCQCGSPIFIVGDFNLPLINWKTPHASNLSSTKESIFTEFCVHTSLHQLVEDITRPTSQTTLDLLLTGNPEMVSQLLVTGAPVRTDHSAIVCCICLSVKQNAGDSRIFDYKRTDVDSIGCSLAATNWTAFFAACTNVGEMYNSLIEYLLFLREIHVPVKRPRRDHFDRIVRHLENRLASAPTDTHALLLRKISRVTCRKRIVEESRLSFRDIAGFYRYTNSRVNSSSSQAVLFTELQK